MDTNTPKNDEQDEIQPKTQAQQFTSVGKVDTLDAKTTKETRNNKKNYKSMEGQGEAMSIYEIITTLLLIITFVATTFFSILSLSYSRRSTETANRATDIAEQALDDSRESAKQAVEENKNRFELEKQQTQAQIDAMKEQLRLIKVQFEVENKPYIIARIPTEYTVSGRQIKISYLLANLGKYPAIATSGATSITIDNTSPSNDILLRAIKNSPFKETANMIIGPSVDNKLDLIMNITDISNINNPTYKVYFSIKIRYRNLIDNSENIFYQINVMTSINPAAWAILYWENTPISK